MKKGILLIFLILPILPKEPPLFPGMIVRCDDHGKCLWECEYGVETSTVIIHENLVLESSGCSAKPESNKIKIPNSSTPPWFKNNRLREGVLN